MGMPDIFPDIFEGSLSYSGCHGDVKYICGFPVLLGGLLQAPEALQGALSYLMAPELFQAP